MSEEQQEAEQHISDQSSFSGCRRTLPSAQLQSRGLYSYDSGCVIRLHGIIILLPKYDKYAYQGKGHIK